MKTFDEAYLEFKKDPKIKKLFAYFRLKYGRQTKEIEINSLWMAYRKFKPEKSSFYTFLSHVHRSKVYTFLKKTERKNVSLNDCGDVFPIKSIPSVEDFLSTSHKREYRVIHGLFFNGDTLSDISKELKLSISMVFKIKEQALLKMKNYAARTTV